MTWAIAGLGGMLVGSIMDAVPKPEAADLTNNTLHHEHLRVKLCGQEGRLHDTLPCHGSRYQDRWRGDGEVEDQSSFLSYFHFFFSFLAGVPYKSGTEKFWHVSPFSAKTK